MSTHHSYEDWAAGAAAPELDLLEAFSGSSIVRWWNQVKFKLGKMVDEQEANRNDEYARLIRTFLNTWEANPITGSINRETLEILKAAAGPMAVMKWTVASYFEGLSTSLDELIADQEQLPAGVPTDQNQGMAGGAGSSLPPLNPSFGPEGEAPPGEEPAPGEEPPGGPGQPGEEQPENEPIPTR